MSETKNVTPMMQQYHEMKAAYKDCLLLFRMGDFYELFYDDAIIAAEILEITLTKRSQDVPMCGVPYYSVDNYVGKLIKAGHKAAICEQLESPEEAKKRGYKAVVKRDVVRVITAGTLTEDNLLEGKSANYLASIVYNAKEVAIAYIDISTLEFFTNASSIENLASDLARVNPSEIIISDDVYADKKLMSTLSEWKPKFVTFVGSFFEYKKAENKIKDNFGLNNLESLGEFTKSQISACGALLEYLCITQKSNQVNILFPKSLSSSDFMIIDNTARKNLEIFISDDMGNSIFKVIDRTLTAAGGRLLRKHLSQPLMDPIKINARLNLVEYFIKEKMLQEHIRLKLQTLPDLERAIARLAVGRGSPHDLYAIKTSLNIAVSLAKAIDNRGVIMLKSLATNLYQNEKILLVLNTALRDCETYFNNDDFIAKEFDERLARLYHIRDNSVQLITDLRNEYRQQTGIASLKLEQNNMLGYYIEVTPSHQSKIDESEFILRQSMVNAKRYTTEKLKALEIEIINAKTQIALIERELFDQIAEQIISNVTRLTETALTMAYLDVISSLALLAVENKYNRPIVDNSNDFIIEAGRHPVVEQAVRKRKACFVSNDCILNDDSNLWLITGPNMAGKSTFLRQNAILAIMAQIGSFIPAEKAKIGVVDRVFSRVGAGDDLAQGRSTFMVEMIETATILNQATSRSLIILDEIGRGTSTYDGVAIAWSCLEYIHNHLHSRALFATHFHELTDLGVKLKSLKCYKADVKEWQGQVIFLHKVVEGIASKSYGINVAELAGLPKIVLSRAKQVLEELHKDAITLALPSSNAEKPQIQNSEVIDIIKATDLDDITPRQALDVLATLKSKL